MSADPRHPTGATSLDDLLRPALRAAERPLGPRDRTPTMGIPLFPPSAGFGGPDLHDLDDPDGPDDARVRDPRSGPSRTLWVQAFGVAICTGLTGLFIGRAAQSVAGDRMAPWILGRASGICAYLLLVALVALGLVLSHPARSRWRLPSPAVRIRAHVGLAVFTLVFLLLHVVVLATDRYAKVGWWGALLPMASEYRPVPVTLGVVAAWSGLLAGLTAGLAGRLPGRVWWPIHKVAALSLVLTFLHGILAGADTGPLTAMYGVTGLGVAALAVSRYRGSLRGARRGRDQDALVGGGLR